MKSMKTHLNYIVKIPKKPASYGIQKANQVRTKIWYYETKSKLSKKKTKKNNASRDQLRIQPLIKFSFSYLHKATLMKWKFNFPFSSISNIREKTKRTELWQSIYQIPKRKDHLPMDFLQQLRLNPRFRCSALMRKSESDYISGP